MKITDESHLDHALTPAHVAWLLDTFGEREGFFLVTLDLPPELPDLPCGLYGPVMGDRAVPDRDAAWAVRGSRKWPSRVVSAPMRPVRTVSVIAGPDDHGNACVLYTAFGGPTTPREPGDTSMNDEQRAEAREFWAQHALATG